jgi:hypothetical protein
VAIDEGPRAVRQRRGSAPERPQNCKSHRPGV